MSFSINGLASGLDTAQIISDMMDIERIPYTNLETKKSNLQTEQSVFRAINTKLSALQRLASDLQYEASYNVNKATSSNTSAITAITTDAAQKASYSLNVTQRATAHSIKIAGSDILNHLTLDTDNKFKIGEFSLTTEQKNEIMSQGTDKAKLEKLASIVNANQSSTNATAGLIDTTGEGAYAFTLTATLTGIDNKINLTHNGASMLSHPDVKEVTAVQDAKLTVNEVEITRASNNIKDAIAGVTLNLQSEGSSLLTVGRDTDAIANKVQSFVTAYNDLISVVKNNLAKPENDETVNPLQGDSLLKTIQNDLYNMFTGIVKDGNGDFVGFMEDIGLSVDKGVTKGSLMTGQITFDKEAFTAALNSYPGKVSALFTDRMTTISNKLFDTYTSSVKGVMTMKITGYDSEIKMVDERLERMDMSLLLKENRLKQQFNNMEVMLSSLKAEQNWLSSQFESLLNTKKN